MSAITNEYRESALRHGIIVKSNGSNKTDNTKLGLATAIELANLGFIVENPNELYSVHLNELEKILKAARTLVGADRDMTPVYPGFPKQVENLDTMTLIVEQILHYITGGSFLPNYPTIAREGLPLEDMVRNAKKVTVKNAKTTADTLIRSLSMKGIALSESEKELLESSMKLSKVSFTTLKEVFKDGKNGENKQTLLKAYCEANKYYSRTELLIELLPSAKNLDEVLRTVLLLTATVSNEVHADAFERAVYHLSDVSAYAFKMKTVSRPARRAIIKRISELSVGYNADRLVKRQEIWRRVMRMVHPYDQVLSNNSARALDIIHDNIEYKTLNSRIEELLATKNTLELVDLLSKEKPSDLLRRAVTIARLDESDKAINNLANAIAKFSDKTEVATLISSYNGVLAASDTSRARVNRVAGRNNTMLDVSDVKPLTDESIKTILAGIEIALSKRLSRVTPPSSPVGINDSKPFAIVRRDLAKTDFYMERGTRLTPVGKGDTVRVFGHWNNNMNRPGYMDIGIVVLGHDFEKLDVITWNTWATGRSWSTYSGDKNVYPGDSAAEYIDVKIPKLMKVHPNARWIAMTVQSWSGFKTCDVDFIAGVMLRSDAYKGEVFDPRSITTAFKPTTSSLQSLPLVIDLETGEMVWIDSSSGSTSVHVSAENDETVGDIVYDEIVRPRITNGKVAELWADAHNVDTVNKATNVDELMKVLD